MQLVAWLMHLLSRGGAGDPDAGVRRAARDSGGVSAVPPPRADQDQEAAQEPTADPAREAAAAPAAPGDRDDPAARARRTALRALAAALPLGAAGSALVLLGARETWSRGVAEFGGSAVHVHATGGQTTALPGALALVGLASLVAVFAVRRAGRHIVAALLALSGAATAATALTRRGDHHALDAAAASATGLRHAAATHASTTGWPLVVFSGGLLLLAAGLLALAYGRHWPAMSGRYERKGTSPARRAAAPRPIDPERSEDLWKALDRGEDPT